MQIQNNQKVLISGASFAGLSTAYWMTKLGYQVTIVEAAGSIKKGGTPVNIMGRTIDTMKRMGLFEQVVANQIIMQGSEFKNADDVTLRQELGRQNHPEHEEEYEIERDVLLNLLYEAVKGDVQFIYGDSITGLEEADNYATATFKHSPTQTFNLVFGCDGIHSVVRQLWFGPEAEFSHFLKAYFSITIVDRLLIPEFTMQMYSEPGRTVMLNAYNGKTDICLAFASEQEMVYNYRDEQQKRSLITDAFKDVGWRTPELLREVDQCITFYFDKLCQLKMPSWTKGRVALVGDAGYCPSPAAGRGGSIAIDGAAALAEAFEKYPADIEQAFLYYNQSFRPFIEEVQTGVTDFALDVLLPKTQEAIDQRNINGFNF